MRRSTRTAHCCLSATTGRSREYLTVPTRNLVPKPDWLSFDEAACLPVAWTTAYRMLFTQADHPRRRPGSRPGRGWRRRVRRDPARDRLGRGGVRHQPQRRKRAEAVLLGCPGRAWPPASGLPNGWTW